MSCNPVFLQSNANLSKCTTTIHCKMPIAVPGANVSMCGTTQLFTVIRRAYLMATYATVSFNPHNGDSAYPLSSERVSLPFVAMSTFAVSRIAAPCYHRSRNKATNKVYLPSSECVILERQAWPPSRTSYLHLLRLLSIQFHPLHFFQAPLGFLHLRIICLRLHVAHSSFALLINHYHGFTALLPRFFPCSFHDQVSTFRPTIHPFVFPSSRMLHVNP